MITNLILNYCTVVGKHKAKSTFSDDYEKRFGSNKLEDTSTPKGWAKARHGDLPSSALEYDDGFVVSKCLHSDGYIKTRRLKLVKLP